ncbi:MAG: 3-isopropylmalate dehydratase [Candidatus Thermoplasmatota archaeon]|nr:3-isopropylmalate dehydratase [Candidatus Thermoplasmatota archaeon]
MAVFKGKAWKFDDDIDTDQIFPGKYLPLTDKVEMGKVAMSGVEGFEDFSERISKGDILLAGENFGCGSSREHAVVTLEYAGISVVVAKSFARIFYRNAVNLGYPILESDAVDRAGQNDDLEVDADAGVIKNLTTGEVYSCTTLSGLEREISAAGGLIPYLNKELNDG